MSLDAVKTTLDKEKEAMLSKLETEYAQGNTDKNRLKTIKEWGSFHDDVPGWEW